VHESGSSWGGPSESSGLLTLLLDLNMNENYKTRSNSLDWTDWTKRLDLPKWTQLDSVVSLYYRTQIK